MDRFAPWPGPAVSNSCGPNQSVDKKGNCVWLASVGITESWGICMKALVVDQSSVMRRVLVGALARVGIQEVDQAQSGDEAIDLAIKRPYAIILMDWNLPVQCGLDVLREIRAKGNSVPIIMVSAEAQRSRVLEALQAGANNYVIKPFDRGTIVSKIQSVLGMPVADAVNGPSTAMR